MKILNKFIYTPINIELYFRCRLDTNFVIYLDTIKMQRFYLNNYIELKLVIAQRVGDSYV